MDDMDDMSEYKEIFLAELSENISLLNSTLIEVEKDPTSASLIQELVRAAHTVKGMAATMGFESLTKLTHEIENHLSTLDRISDTLMQTLFSAADMMQEFHDAIEADGDIEEIDVNKIIGKLKGVAEEDDVKLGQKYKLIIRFDESTKLLGARGFQAYRVIESKCEVLTSDPPIDVLEDGNLLGDIEMEILTFETEKTLRSAIREVGDVKEVVLSALHDTVAPQATPARERRAAKTTTVRGIQSVRVNLDKLDSVVDLLGELVITRGRFQSLIDTITPEISEQFQIFDNTISTIQDTVMGLRMVNLSRIFDTYPRAIRDIAHSRSMEIDLLLQGTHIQIDRSVVDQISEALLHLLRNAAIHGIEDPAIRKQAGKRATGTIRLAARRERGEVVFEVEDDGSGIDVDNIRAKAIREGLIKPDSPFTRAQVASLIFHSGFSTAKELSDVAGRGVGMPIVKETIEEINGNIQIRTKKGMGTKFIIRIPQTLAIIDALIVTIGNQLFAIPLLNVEKIFSIRDPSIEMRENSQYLNWEGYNVRIVNLTDVLKREGLTGDPVVEEEDSRALKLKRRSREKIILWERAGRRVALKVTNILEQREIVTKQLDEVYSVRAEGFLGATILGYDEVALILDPDYY
ncbi:MAG: chemotaxis protein CheA [Candidatus Heimdallarchaeota archaeon]|nr:chemotaxis protein CheA [Candidatus Heimdallarchaeota archaeon]